MAKKIFATEEEINEFLQRVQASLIEEGNTLKKRRFQSVDDKEITFKFKMDEPSDKRKAYILFSVKAWAKMYALVHNFSSEVEWHGLVQRTDENSFFISDILIFPHEVTGSTVISDQTEYEEWLNSLDDDDFNQLRFHGHSHVNMSVFPSSVDMAYRKNVISNFGTPAEDTDYFYIFLITNKRGELSGEIYDLQNNALYTKNSTVDEIEIDVQVSEDDYLSEFLSEANSVVKEAKPAASKAKDEKKEKDKSKEKKSDSFSRSGYGHEIPPIVNYRDYETRKGAKSAHLQTTLFDERDDEDYDDEWVRSYCGGGYWGTWR